MLLVLHPRLLFIALQLFIIQITHNKSYRLYLASRMSPSISSNNPAVQNIWFVSCCSSHQTTRPPSASMLSRCLCAWNARVLGLSWPGAYPWTPWKLALLWFASLSAFQALKVLAAVARTLHKSISVGASMVAFLM